MVCNGTFVARILPEHLLTSQQRKDLVEMSLAEPDKPRFSEQATRQLNAPRMPMTTPDGFGVSQPLARDGIVLGYGDYSVEQIQDGIRRLAMALDSI